MDRLTHILALNATSCCPELAKPPPAAGARPASRQASGQPREQLPLAKWYQARTETAKGTRKTMIVALARKLLIALWRFATTGTVPDGIALRAAA
jgi:hypothetical protein